MGFFVSFICEPGPLVFRMKNEAVNMGTVWNLVTCSLQLELSVSECFSNAALEHLRGLFQATEGAGWILSKHNGELFIVRVYTLCSDLTPFNPLQPTHLWSSKHTGFLSGMVASQETPDCVVLFDSHTSKGNHLKLADI